MFKRRKLRKLVAKTFRERGYVVIDMSIFSTTCDFMIYNNYKSLYIMVRPGKLSVCDMIYYIMLKRKGDFISVVSTELDVEKVLRHDVIPLNCIHQKQMAAYGF